MKKVVWISSAIFAMSASWGLSAEPAEADRIQELKAEIIALATEYQEQTSNLGEVRRQLDPLVDELDALQDLSPEESLEQKVGTWRQLWTDDADDLRANNLFVNVDREQTYQVVLNNGTFYNTSVIYLPFGIHFSAFLKGAYEAAGDSLQLEFKSLKIRLGGIKDVTKMVGKAETNSLLGLLPFPGGAKKPRGPVGVKGLIKTVFIDEELRIDYGQNLDDGVKDLFILLRLPH